MIHDQLTHQFTKWEPVDAERDLMAKQIMENNKKKQAELLARMPTYNNAQCVEGPRPTTEVLSEDRSSREGKFGWARFDNKFVPYLMRHEKKYVALQMMECTVFCSYNHIFNQEIYSCFKVNEFKMTSFEAKLLNEINYAHCDNSFGSFVFPDRSRLITLKDAVEISEFLRFCYEVLALKNANTFKLCGFIRIDSQNCIPYVWLQCKQYVPLFYFDGECSYLEERSVELSGWKLAYMKLLCKIQGIRISLFDHQSIRVVDLELVKKFFPPGTPFEEFWPTENKIDSLIACPTQRSRSQDGNQENITQRAQAKVTPSLQDAKSTTSLKKVSSSKYPPVNVKAPKARSPPNPITNKLVRTTKKNKRITDGTKPPPPYTESSVRTTEENGRIPNSTKPPPPYTGPAVPNSVSPAANLSTLLRLHESPNTNNMCILSQIPDFPFKKGERPYFFVRSEVDNTYLNYCINLLPYNSTVLLVTLEEIAVNLFKVPVHLIIKIINYLQLNVHLPNAEQTKLFHAYNILPATGLIKLNDLLDNVGNIIMLLKDF